MAVDLRRRLGNVTAPVGARGASALADAAEGAARGVPGEGDGSSCSSQAEGGTLAALRERMARMLGSPAPAPRRAGGELWPLRELPFVEEQTPLGPVFARRERSARCRVVGRVGVAAAASAEAELLALLALEPALAGVEPAKALYFDLETTGLTGAGVVPCVVGLAWFEEGALVSEQLFLRSPGEEAALLARVAERVRAASLLVSFNGRAYDWPLLDGRFRMARLGVPAAPPHLDLLPIARRLHRRRIGRCRLKDIEREVLGFERHEDIDGAEVPARYAHFLRTGDEEAMRAVVEHNAWDVASMAALVGLYGEPFGQLCADDLAAMADALRRRGQLERAKELADAAMNAASTPAALEARARVAKARGERAAALRDFATLAGALDEPSLRLELAKLYEHFAGDPERAQEVARLGTGEGVEAEARRCARLARKVERARARLVDASGPREK